MVGLIQRVYGALFGPKTVEASFASGTQFPTGDLDALLSPHHSNINSPAANRVFQEFLAFCQGNNKPIRQGSINKQGNLESRTTMHPANSQWGFSYTDSLFRFVANLQAEGKLSLMRDFRESYCSVAGRTLENGAFVSFNDDLKNGTIYNGKGLLQAFQDLDDWLGPRQIGSSIKGALISANIPEEAIDASPGLVDLIQRIERNDVVSYRDTAFVEIDGKQYLLKVSNNKIRAKIEAAANYHLSSHFDFIVPGMSPEPIEAGDWYFTLQENRSSQKQIDRGLNYWVVSFASFHREAKQILETSTQNSQSPIVIPTVGFRSIDEIEDMYQQGKRKNNLIFKKEEIVRSIKYFENSPYTTLLHNDAKDDNFVGPYLVDLEKCAIGDPALDLAMVLMKYGVPIDNWEHHAINYLTSRDGKVDKQTLNELQEGLQHARVYMATKEVIGSSLRVVRPATRRANQKLAHYALAA